MNNKDFIENLSRIENDFLEADRKVLSNSTSRAREEKIQTLNSLLREAENIRSSFDNSKRAGEENLSQSDSNLDLSVPLIETHLKQKQLAHEFKTEPLILPSKK